MKIKPGKEADHAKFVEMNSQDDYSRSVVDFAERWASLMEQRMSDGAAVRDIAQQASHDADTDGITGFMYGCAVQELSEFWEHGDALRRWHNREYISDAEKADEATDRGGVVNPAIFTVG